MATFARSTIIQWHISKQLPSLGCAEHLLLDPLHLHYSQVFDYMSKFLVDRNLSLKLNFTHSAFWKRIGFDVAHPGVDKTQDPLERRYHKYYQWVCFCLFFQVSFLHHSLAQLSVWYYSILGQEESSELCNWRNAAVTSRCCHVNHACNFLI